MKQFTLCLVVVGLVLAACSQNTGPNYTGNFKKSHFSRDGAGGFGDKEPKILPETFYAAGRLFEGQNQWGKAAIQYQKATAVKHDFAAAYDRLGICFGKLGQHADAVKAFETAVKLEPNYPSFRNNLGFAYITVEDWASAEATLRKAVDLQPDFARARINLGMVLCKLGYYEQGYEQFHAVLPEADSYYNLGLMLRGQQRYQDAAAAFNYALNQNSKFTAAREQLDQIQPRLALVDGGGARLNIPFETYAGGANQYASTNSDDTLTFSNDTPPADQPTQTWAASESTINDPDENGTGTMTASWEPTNMPATNSAAQDSWPAASANSDHSNPGDSSQGNFYSQAESGPQGNNDQDPNVAVLPAVSVSSAPSNVGNQSGTVSNPAQNTAAVHSGADSMTNPTYTLQSFMNSMSGESVEIQPAPQILGSEVELNPEFDSIGYYETDEVSTWDDMEAEFKEEDCDLDDDDRSNSVSSSPSNAAPTPDSVLVLEAVTVN